MHDGMMVLGTGKMYASGTDVSPGRLENDAYLAGTAADGCTLCVTGDVHPVTDEYGSLICEIAGAQKISLKGHLLQMTERALSLAIPCGIADSGEEIGRLPQAGERIPKVNLLFVCSYRQKTLRVLLTGCPTEGIRFEFSGKNPVKIPFSVSAVREQKEGSPSVQVKIS